MDNTHMGSIFTNAWEAEAAQAEMELRQIERERAIEDIVRLVNRFNLRIDDIKDCMGGKWSTLTSESIKPFEPYFSRR